MPSLWLKYKNNLQISGLLLLAALIFWPTVQMLFSRWVKWDQALSHSLPTLAVFFYLLIYRTHFTPGSHQDAVWSKSLLNLILGLGSLCWFLFQINQIELLAALSLIAILCLYLACCYSLSTLTKLIPLFGLLLFTVPLWAQMTDTLVTLSSWVVGKLVNMIAITALIDGNNIFIPSGRIVIADGCSGLRYLTVSLLLGYITCLLNQATWRQTILVLVIATALGLLANWLRIFLLVLIGYYTEMQSSLMQNHETFGWAVFVLIMLPALYFAPVNRNADSNSIPLPKAAPLVPSILLLLGPMLFYLSSQQLPTPNPFTLQGLGNISMNTQHNYELAPEYPPASSIETRRLLLDGHTIRADLAKYTPMAGQKLVPYIDTLYNKDEWVKIDNQEGLGAGNNPQAIAEFRISILRRVNSNTHIVLLHQFNVGKSATGDYLVAKLLQLKARALNQQYFALMTLQSHCATNCSEEIVVLTQAATLWEAHKESLYHPASPGHRAN